ncbi:MAG: DHHW family protein [Oscillospiraceae bacterium]
MNKLPEEKPNSEGRATRREKREAETHRLRLALPFFTVMALLTVVAFIIPLRPKESMSEKRELTAFPSFSAETLVSGEYFDGISAWFSDTFPGREGWIRAAAAVDGLHGLSDVTLYGELGTADEIPTGTPIPTETPSATPAPTESPPPPPEVVVTSPPEKSVEHWGGIDVGNDAEVIFGTVLQIGDAAFAYYGFSQYGSDRYIKLMNGFADAMAEKDVEVYDVLIPTSVGVLVSSDYMEKIKSSDQGASISYMFKNMNDNVKKVNIFNTLVEHNDEYLYFRTDHHWTALGAYYGYSQLCAVAGFEPVPLENYEVMELPGFKGSYFWSCNQNSKLREDTVFAYNPPGDISMQITSQEGGTFPWPVLTDMSKADANSKYMAFLGGDHPMTLITNNDLPEAQNCVLIKDSFGNPFAPFLTQHYHNVYVLDYRSYSAMKLRYFVDYYEIDDVIFAESLAMAQGDGTLDLLESLCR